MLHQLILSKQDIMTTTNYMICHSFPAPKAPQISGG